MCSNISVGIWKDVLAFTIMPYTENLVLLGNAMLRSPPTLFVFTRSSRKIVLPSCEHPKKCLELQLDRQNFLLVLCNWCKDIKLLLIQGGKTCIVDEHIFSDKQYRAYCRGEQGVVYVCYHGGSAHEYRCSSLGIERSYNVIETGKDRFSDMCCITTGQKALVGCIHVNRGVSWYDNIKAVSLHNNSVLWEFNEEINGTKLGLTQLLYVPQDDVILINDNANRRFVVLNPRVGNC